MGDMVRPGTATGPPDFRWPRGGWSGRPGSGGLDRREVELELDLLRDEHATGLEGGVPGEAEVLAVDLRGALEADPDVAEGVLGRAGLLEDDGQRPGDVADGEVAGDGPVRALA